MITSLEELGNNLEGLAVKELHELVFTVAKV